MATKRKLDQEKKYSYVLNHIQSYAKEKKICFMSYDHPKMICLSDGKQIVRIDEYLQVEGHVKLCAEIAGECSAAIQQYEEIKL
ncbi:MAG: hypothetical protein ACRC5A_10995 [Enterobacteriaceae bacterium]